MGGLRRRTVDPGRRRGWTIERLVDEGVLTAYRLDPANPRSKRLLRRRDVEGLPRPMVAAASVEPLLPVDRADLWYDMLTEAASTAGDKPLSTDELDELVAGARARLELDVTMGDGVPARVKAHFRSLVGLVEHYKAGTATLAEVCAAYAIISATARWRDEQPLPTGIEDTAVRGERRAHWFDVFARMARDLLAAS